MEFIIVLIIFVILSAILKYIFKCYNKELKHIGKDKKLDNLADKYPSNIELCREYLKRVNNETVEIEENNQAEASLYIAITNKILIANIQNTYTRIQTIAHECLHSIQDRRLLLFNFYFSNVYLLYFATICILAIFKLLPYKMMFLSILLFLGLIYYAVRVYLENDAMIKARYLAKDYMEDAKISKPDEINQIISGFDKINKVGIKCINYKLFLGIISKAILFCIICIVR